MSFDKDDIEWIGGYAKEVNDVFGSEFEANRDRFREGQLLLDRFGASIQTLLDNGRGYFRGVDEAHNERCIASTILDSTSSPVSKLEYEPSLSGCVRTIDFRAIAQNGDCFTSM